MKKKLWWLAAFGTGVLLTVLTLLITTVAVSAAAFATELDDCIRQDNVLVIATSNGSNEQENPIYAAPDASSDIISSLQGQSCLVCDVSDVKAGSDYQFVKVLLPNFEAGFGYVSLDDFSLGTLDTESFGLSYIAASCIEACRAALQYIGNRYADGMYCMDILNYAYQAAGYDYDASGSKAYNDDSYGREIPKGELAAGDILFYEGLNGGAYNHVAMYLGQGYVIQSTHDRGYDYPQAGVRITKLTFRSSPTGYRAPFR